MLKILKSKDLFEMLQEALAKLTDFKIRAQLALCLKEDLPTSVLL